LFLASGRNLLGHIDMKVGPFIRSMFGPYERRVSELYRAFYFDLDAFVGRTREWNPVAQRILEVGCGEGAVTERLRSAYPEAEITAIDISDRIGRLFTGPRDGIRFVRCSAQDIAAAEPGHYDLIVVCDVLHHVPTTERRVLLGAVGKALSPGGVLIIKEWERRSTPIHWLNHATERWITGDRVSYMTRAELREFLARSFGPSALVAEARFEPWSNNIAAVVQL
jgi:2-polyprenyl-3-methyl-5-hydroxy-6-metoxy-1,4-benzoquinol methylase